MASKKEKCGLHSPLLNKDTGLFLLWKLTVINPQKYRLEMSDPFLGLFVAPVTFSFPVEGLPSHKDPVLFHSV